MCENPAGNPLITTFKKMLVGLVLPIWLVEKGKVGTISSVLKMRHVCNVDLA